MPKNETYTQCPSLGCQYSTRDTHDAHISLSRILKIGDARDGKLSEPWRLAVAAEKHSWEARRDSLQPLPVEKAPPKRPLAERIGAALRVLSGKEE